ncbi:FMN-linked oxidoreductase [Mytilinidion resinicola]|uniref:Dihydroorotate dehydrogenase (fumarate) n=1 Tax=Mytilinidion resinicola TaxID=574789 RepID=A0A6A6Y9W2_9PEZI|nr:FMN-linked oxidoreductase [Mytilinidion resinicola]KAF2804905.1 FMN-linked oxidoreductase [Mytilinidion resinicola]
MKPPMISPPLLNSSNPWCTSLEQLRELYDCPYTGAVTTRTSLLNGFPNDPAVHQYTFYNPSTHAAAADPSASTSDKTGSLNTLGYSPLPLATYLDFIKQIAASTSSSTSPPKSKPFIISVTGSSTEVCECYRLISAHQRLVHTPLAMEINLSCPNIPDKPPPAYHSHRLVEYLTALKTEVAAQQSQGAHTHVPIGIKTPPYTYADQFKHLISALSDAAGAAPVNQPCPISFITATNTLGSSLLLTPTLEAPSSPISVTPGSPTGLPRQVYHHTLASSTGTGIGGLAGAPLHPLALGNVYTIKGLLFQHPELEGIQIIGMGGVEDSEGYKRMRAVGASAVGVGTALGRKGVGVFAEISGKKEG